MNDQRIAGPGDIPRAKMHKPGTPLADFVRGAFYVQAKLAAGWEILPDIANRLLPEWVSPEAPAPKKRGRPKKQP